MWPHMSVADDQVTAPPLSFLAPTNSDRISPPTLAALLKFGWLQFDILFFRVWILYFLPIWLHFLLEIFD